MQSKSTERGCKDAWQPSHRCILRALSLHGPKKLFLTPVPWKTVHAGGKHGEDRSRDIAGHSDTPIHIYTYTHTDTYTNMHTYETAKTTYLQINVLIVFRWNEVVTSRDRNRRYSDECGDFSIRCRYGKKCAILCQSRRKNMVITFFFPSCLSRMRIWTYYTKELCRRSIAGRSRNRKRRYTCKNTRTCAGREQFRNRVDVHKRNMM